MVGVLAVLRCLLAGAVLLFTASASANPVPSDMPAGVSGLWWGQSVKSARRKCETFTTGDQKTSAGNVYAKCLISGTLFGLVFDTKGRLASIGWDIPPVEYDECAQEILNRIGVAGRGEDGNGNEFWALTYTNAGSVMCLRGETVNSITFTTSR